MNAAEQYAQLSKRLTNQLRERQMLGHILSHPEDQTTILTDLKPENFSHHNHAILYGMFQELFRSGLDVTYDGIVSHIELTGKNEAQIIELKELLQSVAGEALPDTVINSIHLLNELLKNRKIYNDILVQGEMMFRNNDSIDRIMAHIASTLVGVETGKKEVPIDVTVDNVIDQILNPGMTTKGLKTGLDEFDTVYGGIKKDRYITIGAAPGVGKTAVAVDLAARLCEQYPNEVAVLYISLEMSEERLVKRFVSRITELSIEKLESRIKPLEPFHKKRAQEAGEIVRAYPMQVVYSTMDENQIALRLKKFALENPGKHLIAILDHIGIVTGNTDQIRIKTINTSSVMKSFCRDHDGTSIVLTQLKKEVNGIERRKSWHEPNKGDIMESGQIEQDSDILMLAWRPEMQFTHIGFAGDDAWSTQGKIILKNDKNRDGQSFTHLVLDCNIACNKLMNSNPFN